MKNWLNFRFYSTPLPPLPTDRKYLPMDSNSNRSSGSSGVYGYLMDHQTLECDEIYAKPMVFKRTYSYPNKLFVNGALRGLKKHASELILNWPQKFHHFVTNYCINSFPYSF